MTGLPPEGTREINQRSYHHGDLRRTILAAAAEAITESGPSGWSLRELARRAGVSHAAPAHHFGDKAGLLTALAVEGFDLLAGVLAEAGGDILDLGTAYVRFAAAHRAHYEVMFQPGLYRADDPEVTAARARTWALLEDGLRALPGGAPAPAALAAWSIVHGFAGLWLSGAFPEDVGDDPEAAARPVIRLLFDR
ncbi:TetR/AcrR family transcriptional regulator [Streptosporangium sp. NPDC004631]